MGLFRYKAIDHSGAVIKGELNCDTRDAAIARLQDLGYLPIEAEKSSLEHKVRGRIPIFDLGRVSHKQIGVLTRQLGTLLSAGMPLDRSLDVLSRVAESDAAKRMVDAILEKIRSGMNLAAALEAQGNSFSKFYISMVRAGEEGGSLEATLQRLADYAHSARELKASVTSALMYPMILVAVIATSLALLLTFVIPQFSEMFLDAGVALPLSTQVVVTVAEWFRAHWWVVGLILVGGAILGQWGMQVDAVRFLVHRIYLRLPLVGDLAQKLATARFARTLATLLANGVPVLAALSISRKTLGNRAIMEGMEAIGKSVEEGRGLAGSMMRSSLFPPFAVHMIHVGEETGRLEEMLGNVADTYDLEVRHTVKRMLSLLEPLLIIGMGVIVGGVIMSLLVAVVSVNELAIL